MVQAPSVFLDSLLGFFPLAFSVCCLLGGGGGVVGYSLVICPPLLGGGRCSLVFLSGACRLALVGLQCLWVPRSCGVPGLRGGVICLRSGLWSSSVCDRNEDFPSFCWVCFLTFVRGPLPQPGAVCCRLRSSGWLSLLLAGWSCAFELGSSSLALVCVGASTVSFSCVFLRNVATLWVNSDFLSLLIMNEGLLWWLFLSDGANPFLGRAVVFIRPPSDCWDFLWLVATLLPGLFLDFAVGCLLLASSAALL